MVLPRSRSANSQVMYRSMDIKKKSCQAKSPMDSSVKSLKQPKNGQSPGSIKITKNTKKTKEEVLDTTIQALITCLKDLKKKKTDASLGLLQGGSGNNRRKSRKK